MAPRGGQYSSHIRGESAMLLDSIAENLLRLSPESATTLGIDKGKHAAAFADFAQAIALNPRNARFFSSRGQARLETGEVDGGLADCDQAIKLEATFARAYYCRGWALYGRSDLAGAAAAFKKAVELDPNMAVAHGNLGWVLLRLGREAEAEKAFAECVRLDPLAKAPLERRIQQTRFRRTKQ